MRHRKKSQKFSRPRAQRKALSKSLVRALLLHERVRTTEPKAKNTRQLADRLITWGKRGDLHSKRLAYDLLQDHKLVMRLFRDIAPRFKDTAGGYTRTIRLGVRKGDGAALSILELTKVTTKVRRKKKKEAKEIIEPEKHEKHEKHEKKIPVKKEKPSKTFMSGVKKIFKKERDAI